MTPLHAVTNVGTTASPATPIRTLPWNRIPNFSTGISSRRFQRSVGRHRVADQSTARFAARAASAPSTEAPEAGAGDRGGDRHEIERHGVGGLGDRQRQVGEPALEQHHRRHTQRGEDHQQGEPADRRGHLARHAGPARDERRRGHDRRAQHERQRERRRERGAQAGGQIEVAALDQRGAEPELAEPDAERDHEDEDGVEAEDLRRQQPCERDAAGGA